MNIDKGATLDLYLLKKQYFLMREDAEKEAVKQLRKIYRNRLKIAKSDLRRIQSKVKRFSRVLQKLDRVR